MGTVDRNVPHIRHALLGRVRLHLPGLPGPHWDRIVQQLLGLAWVRQATLCRLTGNLLVRFDPQASGADAQAILAIVQAEWLAGQGPPQLKLVAAEPQRVPSAEQATSAVMLRRALPWLLGAAEIVLGRRGWLTNVVTTLGPATLRQGLGLLWGRDAATWCGVAADLAAAALSGSWLSLAVATVNTILRTASRVPPALPCPSAVPALRAAA
jgi:hypothetical protein